MSTKHQIILPGNHHVTRILIKAYHETNAHMGAHHILSLMRQKYWVLPGLKSIKSVLSKCMICKRQKQRPESQQMGQLPVERLEPDKPPFTFVGVDFFGPMYVKSGRRQLKRYGCLFTCLCTRAVHIEITHSLNTDSFICAMQRFVSRRGHPEKVYSDNGTNLAVEKRSYVSPCMNGIRAEFRGICNKGELLGTSTLHTLATWAEFGRGWYALSKTH